MPRKPVKTSRTQFILPDISVLTNNPHMHLLERTVLACRPSSGDTHFPDADQRWDFRWQYVYTEKMLHLPACTMIYAEAMYGNTARAGRVHAEHRQCIITVMPYQAGDERISLAKPSRTETSEVR